MYRLTIRKQAIKALSKMSNEDARRIRSELKKLSQNPVRVDVDVKPLRGRPGFRLRAGAWRVIFERREQSDEMEILRIGQRGDVYKLQEGDVTKPQVIRDDSGNPAYAVIPWPEYEGLKAAKAEASLSDEALYDRAKVEDEESFPMELADRLLAGESAISVYRDYRGMTRKQLAEVVGINPIYLSQIEKGRRNGSTRTLVAIARALRVDVDDLV